MKPSRNKILVAVDFEEQSMHALVHSYELASLFDADLLLLYVIEGISILGKLRSPEEYLKNIIEEAREKFDKLEALAGNVSTKAAVKVSALIEKGKPYDKIIGTAREQEVLLIVMGNNSNMFASKSRRIIGSNTLNVIREAHCPVITVKSISKLPGKYTTILLPLDFTSQTKKQVQKAIEFGGYFGAKINIISILRGNNKITKLLKQVQLNQVKNAIQKNGVHCEAEFFVQKEKSVSEMILDYSHKISADLIVIMTQQKKSIIDFYVGSNAQEIISKSEIPVLSIVPSADFKPGMVTSMVDPLGVLKSNTADGVP
ncbi:MAG: universal stress protein [Bacteroidetes bacterium]|nr:MAG: universal stress protein [Bacteroidota bacterium]